MDKFTVNRSFSIKTVEKALPNGVLPHYLHMISAYSGEYGYVTLSIAAVLDYSPGMDLQFRVVEDRGESDVNLFELRTQELSFFLRILSLFNPQNNYEYGLQESFTSPALSSEL